MSFHHARPEQRAARSALGTYWCNVHRREATYVREDGAHTCRPHQGGIMIPCDVVLAPMTVTYAKRRAKRRAA